MNTNHFKGFRNLTISTAVYGLILTGLPFTLSAQSTPKGQTTRSTVKFVETVVKSDKKADLSSTDENSLQGRGFGRKKPLETPTPTPTPTPGVLSQFDIAGRDGVKFHTNRNAWYRVTAPELASNGFDVSSDSTKWSLFSNGNEIAIRVNTDLSIEFYGTGADTPFTDSNVYYLLSGDSDGLRIGQEPGGSAGQTADAEQFEVNVERKDRNNYTTRILNGDVENWFGAVVSSSGVTLDIDVVNLASAGQASIDLKLQGITVANHLITVQVNDFDAGIISYLDKALHQESIEIPLSELVEGTNQITLQAVGAGSDFSYVDAIGIKFPRSYKAINNELSFSVPGGQTARVTGFTESNIEVFEISNGAASRQLLAGQESGNGDFGFSLAASNFDREFIAITGSAASTPNEIVQNTPSYWNESSNLARFVIIAAPEFLSQAQQLADRRQTQGMITEVVLTDDIGDEFGYGTTTPQSVRDFLQLARASWDLRPDFVLLFGDSSFDMRNYTAGAFRNFVPTKLIETFDMETSSDGWLADFDDDGVEDFPIGRLPVGNSAEADLAFEKIVRYETQDVSNSQSALLVADNWFEVLNGELQNLLPNNVGSQRIERSAMSDPEMRQAILNGVDSDPTVVTYLGHGTTAAWANTNILSLFDSPNMVNQKLSFYMLMTCLNGFSHNDGSSSMAESLVLSQNGAIAVWASSGSTYASGQIAMGQEVVAGVFARGKNIRNLGDIVVSAKQTSPSWDARRTWQLFGDPTLIIR